MPLDVIGICNKSSHSHARVVFLTPILPADRRTRSAESVGTRTGGIRYPCASHVLPGERHGGGWEREKGGEKRGRWGDERTI